MEACSKSPTLLVLTGPTGVGKTELALRLAEHYACPIINADSRQIYREIPIGTAAPTSQEQQRVRHYFVGTHNLTEDYNAGQYERDCLQLIQALIAERPDTGTPVAVLTGGSMMYIDAVCHGLDDIPNVDSKIRQQVQQQYAEHGLEWLQHEVEDLDPTYWEIVDRNNPQRLMHCIEVSRQTGQPYSLFRRGFEATERPFRIVKVALQRPREELYARINARVIKMMNEGLEEEARSVYPLRRYNSLQTVGYKEMFDYIDGLCSLEQAVDKIQQNTRHYAKRQMTWFRRDNDIHWLDADIDYEEQIHTIDAWLSGTDRV